MIEARAVPDRPIAAIDRLVNASPDTDDISPTDVLHSPISGYAPPASLDVGAPAPGTSETQLYLVAKLDESGPPLDDGVEWRVFGELPDRDGKLPLIRSARGGDAEFRLRPGRYLVHAGFGRASQAQLIQIQTDAQSQTFVLDAGGVELDATLNDGDIPQAALLRFEIYDRSEAQNGERGKLVARAAPGRIVRLAAGSYHIVSNYGGVNAVRTADFVVEPGKLTKITMQHGAAGVTLKLVSEAGGEAIADTSWVVRAKTDDGPGPEIFAGIGAFPSMILANGEYVVEASHRGHTFARDVTVNGGGDREIEVFAK